VRKHLQGKAGYDSLEESMVAQEKVRLDPTAWRYRYSSFCGRCVFCGDERCYSAWRGLRLMNGTGINPFLMYGTGINPFFMNGTCINPFFDAAMKCHIV